MLISKKRVLVALALGLSVSHGVNAASASAGVGPTDAAAAEDKPTVVTPVDLVKHFPRDKPGYDPAAYKPTDPAHPSESVETKTQEWVTLMVPRTADIQLYTATALLNQVIAKEAGARRIPFSLTSSIDSLETAYGVLKGLLKYEVKFAKDYVSFWMGGLASVDPFNFDALFTFQGKQDARLPKDPTDYAIQGGWTPLGPIRKLFEEWAEDSKTLGDIFNPLRMGEDTGFIGQFINLVTTTESPSLFNPKASVQDNVAALYQYIAMVRDNLCPFYRRYLAERDRRLCARNAEVQQENAAVKANAAALVSAAKSAAATSEEAAAAATRNFAAIKQTLEAQEAELALIRGQLAAQKQSAQEATAALAEAVAAKVREGELRAGLSGDVLALQVRLRDAEAANRLLEDRLTRNGLEQQQATQTAAQKQSADQAEALAEVASLRAETARLEGMLAAAAAVKSREGEVRAGLSAEVEALQRRLGDAEDANRLLAGRLSAAQEGMSRQTKPFEGVPSDDGALSAVLAQLEIYQSEIAARNLQIQALTDDLARRDSTIENLRAGGASAGSRDPESLARTIGENRALEAAIRKVTADLASVRAELEREKAALAQQKALMAEILSSIKSTE